MSRKSRSCAHPRPRSTRKLSGGMFSEAGRASAKRVATVLSRPLVLQQLKGKALTPKQLDAVKALTPKEQLIVDVAQRIGYLTVISAAHTANNKTSEAVSEASDKVSEIYNEIVKSYNDENEASARNTSPPDISTYFAERLDDMVVEPPVQFSPMKNNVVRPSTSSRRLQKMSKRFRHRPPRQSLANSPPPAARPSVRTSIHPSFDPYQNGIISQSEPPGPRARNPIPIYRGGRTRKNRMRRGRMMRTQTKRRIRGRRMTTKRRKR